jgi:hypothetical protein
LKGGIVALPENRQAVLSLLNELNPRILGLTHPAMSCGCGAVHGGAATAVKIDPAGDEYPGQETLWYLWSVEMKATNGGHDWSCGLTQFIDADEVKALFERHFGKQKRDESKGPYRPEVDGVERVHAGLPAAVRIMENDKQIRFAFSWGREQEAAATIEKVFEIGPRRLQAATKAFELVTRLLSGLEPETYRGGPEPELPFESKWLLDYQSALEQAKVGANHIFFQNLGYHRDARGSVFEHGDVVFMKVAVN